MGAWISELRLALRTLAKRPAFALVAVLTISVGIGATTALFGVFQAAFLDPLPFPRSNRLVAVMETFGADHRCCSPASGPDYLRWRDHTRAFSGIAAVYPTEFALTGLGEAERVNGMYATASAFHLLGVQPLLGRALAPEDQIAPGAVVLSYGFWQRRFGRQRDVLGRPIELNGKPYTVVGVMPKGFDVSTPWTVTGREQFYVAFPNDYLRRWRGYSLPVIARLADGATEATAQSDINRLARAGAVTNAQRPVKVLSLHDYMYGDVGREFGMILAAGIVVLLVACGNLAGLELARAAGRETELAVRAALGAGRRAITRTLLAESLLVAAVGGALGIALSFAAMAALKALLPATTPRIADARIDAVTLTFALGATLMTAFTVGMFPAVLAARRGLAAIVRSASYGGRTPASERVRNAFVVGQMALGLVLVNGGAVLVRSYTALRDQSYGFDAKHVLTMALKPAGPAYRNDAAYADYYDRVLAGVRSLRGVERAGTISCLPLFCGGTGTVWVEGQAPPTGSNAGPRVALASVAGDYFRTMHIPLIEGRRLLPRDSVSAATGVVINEAFAKEAWPGQDPIGRRFSYSARPPDWLTVVGVVGDVREQGAAHPPSPQAYAPLTQGWTMAAYLTVRTAGDPTAQVPAVRRAVLAVDPTQPPSDIETMRDRVDRTFGQRRFYTVLIGLFALAALFLAAAGVYGTVSYAVTERARELGVRAALGASRANLVGPVLRRGVRAAVWGMAIGLAGVWATTRVLSVLVYDIKAVDPLTLVGGGATLVLTAVAASALPAVKAARTPPVVALKAP